MICLRSPRAGQTGRVRLLDNLFAVLTNMCAVCEERQSDVTFIPCRHKVCCERCCFRVRSCPLCHQLVLERLSAGMVQQYILRISFVLNFSLRVEIQFYFCFPFRGGSSIKYCFFFPSKNGVFTNGIDKYFSLQYLASPPPIPVSMEFVVSSQME